MRSSPTMGIIWWKTNEAIEGQRLGMFLTATHDPDDAPIALYRRKDGADVGLTMRDLGNLAQRHREYLANSLTPPSEKAWRRREFELAYLGAKRLEQHLHIKLDPAFLPQQPEGKISLDAKGQKDYQHALRVLRTGTPNP